MMYAFTAVLASSVSTPIAAFAAPAAISSPQAAPPAQAPAPAPPPATVLPPPVRAMIDAAISSGDKRSVETVFRLARQTNPGAASEIDEMQRRFSAQIAARTPASPAAGPDPSGIFDHWKGQVELGASRSTGSSKSLGVFTAFDITRERGQWRHKLRGRIDYQSTGGVTSAERGSLLYQPHHKVSDRLYGFGLGQYEYDSFARYGERHTLGAGFGYGILAEKDLTLDLEGGPTFRSTDPREGEGTSQLVGRASARLKWTITPTLQIGHHAELYLEEEASNATMLTTLDSRLIGALRARLSFNVRYESQRPAGAGTIDTQSRMTLVYGF